MSHFYRRQPPRGAKVAGGSPLGRGITAHFPLNGTLASAARNRGRAPVVTAGPALRTGAAGWFVQGSGSGKIVYPDLLPAAMGVVGASPRTIVAEFYMGDTSASKCVLSFGDTSAGMRTQFTLLTNNQYRSVQLATYGNDVNYSPFSTGGTGAKVFLIVAYDGNTTLTFRSWSRLDSTGEVVFNSQTSTLGGPLNTGNTVPLNLMGGGTYGFAPMVTALHYLSIYGGRCLTPAEMDRLYADRHQVMAAPVPFPYAALAVPAPVVRTLSAGTSGFSLAAAAAVMRASRRIAAIPAGVSTIGAAVGLRAGRRLPAALGGFDLGIAGAQLLVSRRLSAAVGAHAFSGNGTSLRGARKLAAGGGTFSMAVRPVDMVYVPGEAKQEYVLVAAVGTLELAGSIAALRARRGIVTGAGMVSSAGSGVRLVAGRKLVSTSASFALQVSAAALRASRRMSAELGVFNGAGSDVQLRYSAQIDYASAPAGPGYVPQRRYNESRPAATSSPRPAAIQRNYR